MFRKYPILKASLWSNTFGDLELFLLRICVGPYASCVIDDQHSAVVSLYQVSGTCLTSMSLVLTALRIQLKSPIQDFRVFSDKHVK